MPTHLFRRTLLFVLAAAWSFTASGRPEHDPLRQLSIDPTWIRLLHYESGIGATYFQSAIHSPEFFLSPTGPVDSHAELIATIEALSRPPSEPMNDHAQCRFPARYQWLRMQLGEVVGSDHRAQCTLFREWTRGGQVRSLSVVFASGFLGNPASYYGHTLLKFNFSNDSGSSHLIDESVNYGAIVPSDENPVSYILKGLFGGYDGGFSHVGFYFHNHNYGDSELRDLWEYRLALQQDDVDFIVSHAWEVMGKRYQYFFLGRNCAYRMAELLEIAQGVHALPPSRPWTIPQAHLQQIAQGTYQGKPLLDSIIYHPSRQSRFYNKLTNLSQTDKVIFKQLVRKHIDFEAPTFQRLPIESKQAIADTAIDYYQFVGNPLRDAPKSTVDAYHSALSMRYQLAPGLPELKSTTPRPPHLSRAPSWLQLGVVHNSEMGPHNTLRMRPAYYDVVDSEGGHVANSVLTMADMTLESGKGDVWLKTLDLINIESAGPSLSGLRGDNGASWKLRASVEQLNLLRHDHLIAKVSGDIGIGYEASKSLHMTAYVGGALQSSSTEYGVGYLSTSISAVFQIADGLNGNLSYQRRRYINSQKTDGETVFLEVRKVLDANTDIRFNYRTNEINELGIGLGWYW